MNSKKYLAGILAGVSLAAAPLVYFGMKGGIEGSIIPIDSIAKEAHVELKNVKTMLIT